MNTYANNNPSAPANGVHRGIWIGGALMALTIVALATTLVVRSNDANTAAPLAGAPVNGAMAPVNESVTSSVAQPVAPSTMAGAQQAPVVIATPRPVYHPRPAPSPQTYAYNETRHAAAVCTSCGVIESYDAVQVQGQTNGVGAAAGGLGGALIGSQIAGRGNHTLGGVIGAIGGGLLGNTIERHERTVTVYDVHVRMNDGTTRTFRENSVPAVGSRVTVDGQTLHREAPSQSYSQG